MRPIIALALGLLVPVGCDRLRAHRSENTDAADAAKSNASASDDDLVPKVPAGFDKTKEYLSYTGGRALAVSDVNGDGVDDVIGPIKISGWHDGVHQLAAIDGKTQGFIWRSKRVPEWRGELPRGAQRDVLVTGGRVVVAHGAAEVELYDARTGVPVKTIALAGVPGTRACVDPGGGRVFFPVVKTDTKDGNPDDGALVDVVAAAATAAAYPAWCPRLHEPGPVFNRDCALYTNRHATARCLPAAAAPKVAKFEPSYALTIEKLAVAIGATPQSDGHTRATFVGFDPASKKVLWTRVIEPKTYEGNLRETGAVVEAELAVAGLFVALPARAALQTFVHRLIAIDPATGAIRFEKQYDKDPGGLITEPRAIGDRVYLPRGNYVVALDSKTGEIVGSFGYDLPAGFKSGLGFRDAGVPEAFAKP